MGKYIKDSEIKDYVISKREWETRDGDHYPSITENVEYKIISGKNSFMIVRYGGDYSRGWTYEDKTGITVYFPDKNGKAKSSLFIHIGPDFDDLHKLIMAENYILENLSKLSLDKALKSPLYSIKQKIEDNLAKMVQGESTTLEFDLMGELGETEANKMLSQIKLERDIALLIENDEIPPETKFRKYSRDEKKFYETLPKIKERYEARKNAMKKKAEIKERKQTLRLAKKESIEKHKEELKQQRLTKKQEKEELEKSIYEVNL